MDTHIYFGKPGLCWWHRATFKQDQHEQSKPSVRYALTHNKVQHFKPMLRSRFSRAKCSAYSCVAQNFGKLLLPWKVSLTSFFQALIKDFLSQYYYQQRPTEQSRDDNYLKLYICAAGDGSVTSAESHPSLCSGVRTAHWTPQGKRNHGRPKETRTVEKHLKAKTQTAPNLKTIWWACCNWIRHPDLLSYSNVYSIHKLSYA